ARRGETFTEMATVFTNPAGEERFLLTSGAPIRDEDQAIKGAVVVFQDVTQLYQLQREANDQRKFAEAIIDSTPFGLAVFAPTDDFRCLRHNVPFLRLVGANWRTHGNINEVPLADLFDAESAARTRAVFEQVRATGEPFFLAEYPAVLPPDTAPRWYEWSLTPLHDSVGALSGLMVAAVEITEQVRAREAKEREAARLQAVLNVLPTGVAIADADGRIMEMNPAFLRLWGASAPKSANIAEYAAYQAWKPDGHPLSPEEWAMSITLRTGEAVLDQELEILTFDGVRKRVLNSAAPIRDFTSGMIIGGTVAIRDITGLKQLEKRTQASLDALLRMTQQAVLSAEDLADVAHGIAQVTREVLGCQRVGVVAVDVATGQQKGLAVVGLTTTEEAHWWELQKAAGRFGEGADPELLARFVNGEPLVIDMTQAPNADQPNEFGITQALFIPLMLDNTLLGVLSLDYAGMQHVFTEQEFALARGVADLAALVMERERLQRAHAESQARAYSLQVTNTRMNTFLGIASHELRTPITSVKTSVQMTERGLRKVTPDTYTTFVQQTPRLLNLLSVADREIDKLNRFIGDLLDVTHIQSGTIEITPAPTNLGEIVREVARTQEMQWPQRIIRLDAPLDPVPVLGDADRLGQVVTNLLTNALKYAPAERPIDVRLRVGDDLARVEIVDQGPGLTSEQRGELFQAFGRIEAIAPLNSSSVGLGLGLFICKTIIEMMGGSIGVESERGHGATFWFDLPLLHA
ncbi:MAG: PAS domain-containing protein, partial [Ktedonobacterales bacterium]|nr:PAS domain-containing protein [Ktedonobacterales bacterium]